MLINAILKEIERSLNSISDSDISELVNKIINSDKVVCYGAGRMGLSLKAFSMRLNHLGIKSYFYTDNYVEPLTERSLFLVASGSGETKSVIDIINLVRRKTEAFTYAICGVRNSSLSKVCNQILYFKPGTGGLNNKDKDIKIESCQIMSTLNEQVTYILYDIISYRIKENLGLSDEDIKKNHFNVE